MTTQHTPTPWMAKATRIYSDATDASSVNREIAVATRADPLIRAAAEANAAFIVEAVNAHAANVARIAELEAALRAIEGALDGKRNRFGKLESYTCRDLESLRVLAVKHDIGGSTDNIEQSVKVARAVLGVTK